MEFQCGSESSQYDAQSRLRSTSITKENIETASASSEYPVYESS